MTRSPEPEPPETLRILHLDDDLVVCSKPPHMAVHRGPRSDADERFVLQTLSAQIEQYLYPVHRLDRNTSGVLTFALQKDMAKALQAHLQSEETVKEYLVLGRGDAPEFMESDRPLRNENDEPQPCYTSFHRVFQVPRATLMRARIKTGRTHQIRRHLNHLAHHVIGDSTYGKGRINKWFRERCGLPRMFLHARRLVTKHPRTDEPLEFIDPLPDDLRDCLLRMEGIDSVRVAEL